MPSQKCLKSKSDSFGSMFSSDILTHSFLDALERYGHFIFGTSVFLLNSFCVFQGYSMSSERHIANITMPDLQYKHIVSRKNRQRIRFYFVALRL